MWMTGMLSHVTISCMDEFTKEKTEEKEDSIDNKFATVEASDDENIKNSENDDEFLSEEQFVGLFRRPISTSLGLLILLLTAILAGSSIWWYSFSYETSTPALTSEHQASREFTLASSPNLKYEVRMDGLYYMGRLTKAKIDVDTFIFLGDVYAKDKNMAYALTTYGGVDTRDTVDLATFEAIAGKYAKDTNNIYYRNFSGIKEIESADIDTFAVLMEEGKGYAQDIEKIYYGSIVIPEADLLSFEILGGNYSKDAEYVYFENTIIKEADPRSFEFFTEDKGTSIGRDTYNVYLRKQIIVGLSPETLQLINSDEDSDLGTLVLKNNEIIYWVSEFNYYPMEEANPETFEMFPGGFYAKDDVNLYFFSYYEKPEIPSIKIDAKTLTYISHDYYVDKDSVYYLTQKSDVFISETLLLNGVDPVLFRETLIVLDECVGGMFWGSDYYITYDNLVYCGAKEIEGADARTFEVVGSAGNAAYARDEHFAYKGERRLEGIDGSTFRTFGKSPYTADVNNVYFQGIAIDEADPTTFELLYNSYPDDLSIGKDKNNVYKKNKIIEGADVETFVWIGDIESSVQNWYAKDKNHAYYYGEPIKESDPNTFTVVAPLISKDVKYVYNRGKIVEDINPSICTRENIKACEAK